MVLERDHDGTYSNQMGLPYQGHGNTDVITRATFLELMQHLIKENYIFDLKKQVIGIPMGSPVSLQLANLFRYNVEAAFVESLVKNGEIATAKKCDFTFAYIDDLLTFGGPLPTEEDYDIPMNCTVVRKTLSSFIGMS